MTAGRVALRAAAGLGLGFILLPLVLVSWLAFFRNEVVVFPPAGYTLRWFGAILAGLALGVPASLALARHRFPGLETLSVLLLMPLAVPGVVAGTAIYVFQVETEIRTGLPLVASLPGLVFAHVVPPFPGPCGWSRRA